MCVFTHSARFLQPKTKTFDFGLSLKQLCSRRLGTVQRTTYILEVLRDEDNVVDPALRALIEQFRQRVAVTHVDVVGVNTHRHRPDADVP